MPLTICEVKNSLRYDNAVQNSSMRGPAIAGYQKHITCDRKLVPNEDSGATRIYLSIQVHDTTGYQLHTPTHKNCHAKYTTNDEQPYYPDLGSERPLHHHLVLGAAVPLRSTLLTHVEIISKNAGSLLCCTSWARRVIAEWCCSVPPTSSL